MSWCTSGVGLQGLPFIDNSHWWSILHFQRFLFCLPTDMEKTFLLHKMSSVILALLLPVVFNEACFIFVKKCTVD